MNSGLRQEVAALEARKAARNSPTHASQFVLGLKGATVTDLASSLAAANMVGCSPQDLSACTSSLKPYLRGLKGYMLANESYGWPRVFERTRCVDEKGVTCGQKAMNPEYFSKQTLTVDRSIVQDTLVCGTAGSPSLQVRPAEVASLLAGERVNIRSYGSKIKGGRKSELAVYEFWPESWTCTMITPCPVLFTLSDMNLYSELSTVVSIPSCRQQQGVLLVQLDFPSGDRRFFHVLADIIIREAELVAAKYGSILDPSRSYIFAQSASTPAAVAAALMRPDLFSFVVLAGLAPYAMGEVLRFFYPNAMEGSTFGKKNFINRHFRDTLRYKVPMTSMYVKGKEARSQLRNAWTRNGSESHPRPRLQVIAAYLGEVDFQPEACGHSLCYDEQYAYNAVYAFTDLVGSLTEPPALELRVFSPGGHAVWRGAFNEAASLLWTGKVGREDWFETHRPLFATLAGVMTPLACLVLLWEGGFRPQHMRRFCAEPFQVRVQRSQGKQSQIHDPCISSPSAPPLESAGHAAACDEAPPVRQSLASLLEEQFHKCAENTALVLPCTDCSGELASGGSYTYGELRRCSTEVAAHLQRLAPRCHAPGGGQQIVVGIRCERGFALVEAMLGCILSRCCTILPLEPPTPLERCVFYVERSCCSILLSENSLLPPLQDALKDIRIVGEAQQQVRSLVSLCLPDFDQGRCPEQIPPDTSMLFFTSGSTGKPCAVAFRDASAVHSAWCIGYVARTDRRGSAQEEAAQTIGGQTVMSPIFLVKSPSWWSPINDELFGCLLRGGGAVVAPPGAHADPARLARLMSNYKVNLGFLVPSLVPYLVAEVKEQNLQLSVRNLVFLGEPLSLECCKEAQAAFPQTSLHNLYASTECGSTVWTYGADPSLPGPKAPGGRAQPLLEVHIVDDNLNLLPPGEVGEILMGGASRPPDLYFRPDEVTARRFVTVEGSRGLYFRSGDLGVWHANGILEVLGRRDRQVKIHGARIELQEVELGLLRAEQDLIAEAGAAAGQPTPQGHNHTTEVAVVAASDGDASKPHLVAFVASSLAVEAVQDKRVEQKWSKRLRDRVSRGILHAYMVPHLMVPLKGLPRLQHGKPDMVKLNGLAVQLRKTHMDSNSGEVVGSLGMVRSIGKQEARLLRMKESTFGIAAFALLWGHWLPHDPKVYLNWSRLSETQLHSMRAASSLPVWGVVGIMMGCEVGVTMPKQQVRRRREVMDAIILMVVYTVMGWPRACSTASGFDTFATFHRWSCVAIAYVKALSAASSVFESYWLRPVMGAAAFVAAPYLDKAPLVPRPSAGATRFERVFFEDFVYGDMGLAARILGFYLFGCSALPPLLALKTSVLKHAQMFARGSFRLTCLLAAAGMVWKWLCLDALVDPLSGRDMPNYYDRYYALRVSAESCLAVMLGVALDGDSWILAVVGRAYTGTYLIHPYLSLEVTHIMFGALEYHFVVVVGAMIWLPLAFSLTVGTTAQWVLVRIIRMCR